MGIKLQAPAVASQRAIATGNQIVNLLGGFRQAYNSGFPAVKNEKQEEIMPAVTAAQFQRAASDAFGEDMVNKFIEFADALDPEQAQETVAPAAKFKKSRRK